MLKKILNIKAATPFFLRSNGFLCFVLSLLCSSQVLASDISYEEDVIAAAKSGDPQSQFALALLYEHGAAIVDRDPSKAIEWFEKAGRKKVEGACLYLGLKYEYGNRVKKDLKKAACWYECAARKDWPAAQFFLASMYEKGKGVRRSSFDALVWFGLAAEYGYPGAQAEFDRITSDTSFKDMDRLRRKQERLLRLDPPSCN